jgi:hypothetical protein
VFGLGLKLSHKLINIGLPGAKSTEEGDFSVVSFGYIRNSDRLLMDIHADVERARLWHG